MKKLIMLFSVIFITGCTKYHDLAELTIIKSIGISYDENYTIYAQIIDSINKDNEPVMKTIKENGKTVKEGFNKIKKAINKDAYLSHIDLLILDTNLNNNNYQDIINYFIDNNDFRNDFYSIFSTNLMTLLEHSKYDEIEIFLKSNQKGENLLIKTFNDVTKEFIDNKTITLSNIFYQDEITYLGNIKYDKKENIYAKEN